LVFETNVETNIRFFVPLAIRWQAAAIPRLQHGGGEMRNLSKEEMRD
jgi:hypothetical protein